MAAVLELGGVVKVRRDGERTFQLRLARLTLRPGALLALVGASGCGKSTAIDLAALALSPGWWKRFVLTPEAGPAIDVGRLWQGRCQDALARLRARHFGYVVQTGELLPFLSVRENILLPQRMAGRPDPDFADQLARYLGIETLLSSRPARLSVGQRQRVAIARALVARPSFVLADEPTAALDPATARTAFGLLVDLAQSSGAGLLVATHTVELAESMGFRILRASTRAEGNRWQTVYDDGGNPARSAPTRRSEEASS